MRVVFDTTTVVSALLFSKGRLAWLRDHWRDDACVPLLSAATAAELIRVLGYEKFRLSQELRRELLADYIPFCEVIQRITPCAQVCRDQKDQPFLDLAHSGEAQLLVSGDNDLLALAGQAEFLIETPEEYRLRVQQGQ